MHDHAHLPLVACSRCPHSHRPCAGPCPCTLDGVEIRLHAAAGYCPDPAGPRFGSGTAPINWDQVRRVGQLCGRCGGAHAIATCPIPAGTSPERERQAAQAGGCCGAPNQETR